MRDRQPFEQAVTDDAMGRATPEQEVALARDLDRWSACLRRVIVSIEEQLQSRQQCAIQARQVGDITAAEQHEERLRSWWPRASALREAAGDRLVHVDGLRAVQAHQQLRAAVDHLIDTDQILDHHVHDQLARLLDRLDHVDTLDLSKTA